MDKIVYVCWNPFVYVSDNFSQMTRFFSMLWNDFAKRSKQIGTHKQNKCTIYSILTFKYKFELNKYVLLLLKLSMILTSTGDFVKEDFTSLHFSVLSWQGHWWSYSLLPQEHFHLELCSDTKSYLLGGLIELCFCPLQPTENTPLITEGLQYNLLLSFLG